MALGNGRKTIPISEYPDDHQPVRLRIDDTTGFSSSKPLSVHFDKQVVIDQIKFYSDVDAAGTSGDDVAVSACRQTATATSKPTGSTNRIALMDLADADIGSPVTATISESENLIEAGGAVCFAPDATVATLHGEFVIWARPWVQ